MSKVGYDMVKNMTIKIQAVLDAAKKTENQMRAASSKSVKEIENNIFIQALTDYILTGKPLNVTKQGLWQNLYAELWSAVYDLCPTDPVSCAQNDFNSVYTALCANFAPMKGDHGEDIQTFQIGCPGHEYNNDMAENHDAIPINMYTNQPIIVFGMEKMWYRDKTLTYGVNIGPGHDSQHCAYIDCIADMTNPRHFAHLPVDSFSIIDSEHIPLPSCWRSPFFANANRLLRTGGLLVFSGKFLQAGLNALIVEDRTAFLKAPTEYGFVMLAGQERINAKVAMTYYKDDPSWEGVCFQKTENMYIKDIKQTFPSISVLLSRSSTFFQAVMFCKAATYINTINKVYTDYDITALQDKQRLFYTEIKQAVTGKQDEDALLTIEDARRDPKTLFKTLRKLRATGLLTSKQFEEMTLGSVQRL